MMDLLSYFLAFILGIMCMSLYFLRTRADIGNTSPMEQLQDKIRSVHLATTQLRSDFSRHMGDASKISNIQIMDRMKIIEDDHEAIRMMLIEDRERFSQTAMRLLSTMGTINENRRRNK